MDEPDDEIMTRYGITAEKKMLYHYGGYRYERLTDAVNYARTRQAPANEDGEPALDDRN